MLDLLLLHLCKDGEQQIHRYGSKDIGLPMRFSAYTSPKALHINANVLALVYLTGLTSVRETFPIKTAARLRIFWHYLGDRSPFMLALRIRRSIAHCRRSRLFAAPMQCRSCEKAFNAYPSDDGEARKQYNASELVRRASRKSAEEMPVGHGLEDTFVAEPLHLDFSKLRAWPYGGGIILRRHAGHEHGYYCISTCIKHYLRFCRNKDDGASESDMICSAYLANE